MRKSCLAGALVLTLGACGGDEEAAAPQQNNAAATETAEQYNQRIQSLGEGQRNAVFIRAIRDAGRDCQHVQSSAPAPDVAGAPAWTATCDNGAEWIVILGDAGMATVTNEQELAAVGAGSNVTNQTNQAQ